MVRRQQGFTLTELIITVVIIGVLAGLALPSFARMLERNRIKTAAEGLRSDLVWARTQAVKQNDDVTIAITTGTSWQYAISSTDAGSMKTVTSTSPAISISASTFAANTLTFNSRRGEGNDTDSSDDEVTFSSTHYQLNVEIENGWNIKICNPVSADAVVGYELCS